MCSDFASSAGTVGRTGQDGACHGGQLSGSWLVRSLGRNIAYCKHCVSRSAPYAASARQRANRTSRRRNASALEWEPCPQLHPELFNLTEEVSRLTKERLEQQQQLLSAQEASDGLLSRIRVAGVNTHWWRRELRSQSSSSSSSSSSSASSTSSQSSSSSRSSTSPYSPASCSCGYATCSSPSQSSSSSSAAASPAASHGRPPQLRLRLLADSLQDELQEGDRKLRAARNRAAALEEQLPVIEALSDDPATATTGGAAACSNSAGAATGGASRADSHVARLRTIVFRVALSGSPPVHVPPLHPHRAREDATLLKCETRRGPKDPVTGLRGAREARPGTHAVWILRSGGEQYIAKVVPCHSAKAETDAQAAADSATGHCSGRGREGGGKRTTLRPVTEALREAVNAARINDACAAAAATYTAASAGGGSCGVGDGASSDRCCEPPLEPMLPPSAVLLRDCSLRGTELDAGHDKEAVILYPYCPAGDAYEWLGWEAESAARAALARAPARPQGHGAGRKGLSAAAEELAGRVQAVAADMARAVAAVHRAGWVLGDHKPENMVWAPMLQRWALIDAAAAACCRAPASGLPSPDSTAATSVCPDVHGKGNGCCPGAGSPSAASSSSTSGGCPDGWLPGAGTHTRLYAAPEQLDKVAPRRGQPSDVFSLGVSVEELIELAAERFGSAVGEAVLAAGLERPGQAEEKHGQTAEQGRAQQGRGLGRQGGGSRRALRAAARSTAWRARNAVRAAARRLGLSRLAVRCTEEEPEGRPCMEAVCRMMGL